MYDPLCGVKVVNFMSNIISVRVNETEKEILKKASTVYGCAISSLMKKLVFEKLEEEYDLRAIEEYEKEKADGTLELFDFDETVEELKI